ncbi:MAG: tetratricopeptide repeat protein [Candidatus Omnitrophota bacterium]
MRKLVFIILQVVIMSGSFCLLSFAEDSAKIVGQANSLYKQGKYDEAIKLYNQAQIKSPDSSEINYNIGIAEYKKSDYNQAISFFEKATSSQDKILESKANFNIANSKYRLGKLKENTELKETVSLMRQALDYYKRAIELNSKDQDAKINHELVEKELKILLDKLKQEQDKQKGQSGQEKEGQDDKKEQAALGQDQKAKEQKKEEPKEGQEIKQAEEQQGSQDKESANQASGEAKDMSKEEANMLLEGYRQEENSAGKLEDNKKGNAGEVSKDW